MVNDQALGAMSCVWLLDLQTQKGREMLRNAVVMLLLVLAIINPAGAAQERKRLHADQMGDIVLYGQVTGEDGARYDIWIVPGYVGALKDAAGGWSAAGSDFAEYGSSKLYEDIYDDSKAMLKFAGGTAVVDFALKGSANAWAEAFDAAAKRCEKRVFGWWAAYPWAIIEATGESVFRLVIGIPGGAIVATAGVTIVPAAEFLWPTVKGVYHGVIKGTALPIVAVAWNTVIVPPMALTGHQPTAERADGFWMRRLSVAEVAKEDPELQRLQAEIKAWRKALVDLPDVQAVSDEVKRLQEAYREKHRQLNGEEQRLSKDLNEKRITLILQKAEEGRDTLPIDKEKLAEVLKRHGKKQVLGLLVGDGIAMPQAEALLATLVEPDDIENAADDDASAGPARKKTDPLKRRVELLTH
jgi:hypothetical protein